MHILITGGDSALARRLADALAPTATIRLFDRAFDAPLPEGVQQATGDPCDPAAVSHALNGIDAILHLAALSSRT